MIYTVTLNPAIDKTVEIGRFRTGAVNRVASVREDAGGKGINVSKCLQSLGEPSTAAVILAGAAGQRLKGMLEKLGIAVLSLNVEGQSRTNLKIIDPENKENTDINEPGPTVSRECLEALKHAVGSRVQPGDLVILSGSLPAGAETGLYADWIRWLQQRGVCVYLDADGEPLRAGLTAVPWLIKPNQDELAALLGKSTLTREEMLAEGRRLLDTGIRDVLVSMGGDGVLLLSREGCFLGEGLSVPVKSTVGAGDSVVAAAAYGQVNGLCAEERLRLCVAMGAASVMQSGTQPPEAALVWELAKQVKVQKV